MRDNAPTMNYLHYNLSLASNDVVEVRLDKQANVRLLDPHNYTQYKQRKRHRYYGGLVKVSPFRLKVPHAGQWHLVVDLGGYAGSVKASINVIKGAT